MLVLTLTYARNFAIARIHC